jgi:two-component system response regulator LytT
MNEPLKVLVVEDDFAVALDIKTRLVAMGFTVVATAGNFEQAIAYAAELEPEVVLMDIHIEGTKTGIDAAKIIWGKLGIPVIYLTGLSDAEVIEQAMATQPLGYVLKPCKDVDIHNQIMIAVQQKKALDFLLEKTKNKDEVSSTLDRDPAESEMIFVKDNKHIVRLELKDITYLEAMDNYTLLYTTNQEKWVVNGFLKDVIEKINDQGMMRIHRSYAVAKRHIKKIEDNVVTVGTRVLPISKSHRENFYAAINPI